MSCYYWLVSYPKSGNTWLRLALKSLSQGGAVTDFSSAELFAPVASDRAAMDEIIDVDTSDLTPAEEEAARPAFFRLEASSLNTPQLRKVHDAWTRCVSGEPLFPDDVTAGAIYIVRDPRDVAVSLAHHHSSTIEATIAFMADPNAMLARGGFYGAPQLPQRLLTWSGHVRSWRDGGVTPLLLRYEDMLGDPVSVLARAARHLGWDFSEDAVSAAVAATRFDVLKAAEERHGFRERARPEVPFFRRGIAGAWRESLSAAQQHRIEADHSEVMTALGYL
jgi:aryl sulfotransferase